MLLRYCKSGVRYREILTKFLWFKLTDIDIKEIFNRKSIHHFDKETIALLRQKFSGRIILRNDNVSWPPRSCNHVKSHIYKSKPIFLTQLILCQMKTQLYQNIKILIKKLTAMIQEEIITYQTSFNV